MSEYHLSKRKERLLSLLIYLVVIMGSSFMLLYPYFNYFSTKNISFIDVFILSNSSIGFAIFNVFMAGLCYFSIHQFIITLKKN